MPSSLQLHRINPTNLTTIGNFSKPFTPPETSITRRTITFCENNNIRIPDSVACHHSYMVKPNQCCSAVVQTIRAPAETVWSVVRRFDNPHAYKHFLKSCEVVTGDGNVGTVREVHVVSGLPAESSMERLEVLDDEKHVLSFKIVGGDHRLANYQSVTTLHCEGNDHESSTTVVVESYVVDVPAGNTCEETCVFVDTIVRCNLQSLAQMAENIARKNQNEL